jgi:cytochrome c553
MSVDRTPIPAEPEALYRPWRIWASVIVAGFVAVSLVIGLLVLPWGGRGAFDPLASICRAIGVPGYARSPNVAALAPAKPASLVAWSADTRDLLAQASATRGEALAKQTCAACHGENGITTDPQQFPSLAGQSQAALYKELQDFKSGARNSPIMAPMAQPLSGGQMADVAAYYATRPPPAVFPARSAVSGEITRLARDGDPTRAIPSCDSCHGASHSGPEGTPFLLGQSPSYIEQQLKNFADRTRNNDLFERMRAIAPLLSPAEIHGLAIYYGGAPGRA